MMKHSIAVLTFLLLLVFVIAALLGQWPAAAQAQTLPIVATHQQHDIYVPPEGCVTFAIQAPGAQPGDFVAAAWPPFGAHPSQAGGLSQNIVGTMWVGLPNLVFVRACNFSRAQELLEGRFRVAVWR